MNIVGVCFCVGYGNLHVMDLRDEQNSLSSVFFSQKINLQGGAGCNGVMVVHFLNVS